MPHQQYGIIREKERRGSAQREREEEEGRAGGRAGGGGVRAGQHSSGGLRAYRKYGTDALGIIILAFSSLSRKYLTLEFISASKCRMDATLPQR